MTIRTILLVLDAHGGHEAASLLSAGLARRFRACITPVCLYHEPEPTVAEAFVMGPVGVANVIDRFEADVHHQTAAAQAAFERATGRLVETAGWTVGEIDEWRNAVGRHWRFADLVVVSSPAKDRGFRRVVADLVLQCGAPCLAAPAAMASNPKFQNVVIAWNGSREAARALHDALPLVKQAQKATFVVGVEDGSNWIDDHHTDELQSYLARHGVIAEAVRSPVGFSGAGEAVLATCKRIGADLLVMGAYGHSRAEETILGGATRTVLANAALPVLMSH